MSFRPPLQESWSPYVADEIADGLQEVARAVVNLATKYAAAVMQTIPPGEDLRVYLGLEAAIAAVQDAVAEAEAAAPAVVACESARLPGL